MIDKFEVGMKYRWKFGNAEYECLFVAENGDALLQLSNDDGSITTSHAIFKIDKLNFTEIKEPRKQKYRIAILERTTTKEIRFVVDSENIWGDRIGQTNSWFKCLDVIEVEWVEKDSSSK